MHTKYSIHIQVTERKSSVFFPPQQNFLSADVCFSCCEVFASPSTHSPPLLCLLLNLKARRSVRKTARQRDVISSSKQRDALYNMFSVHINSTFLPSFRQDLLPATDKQWTGNERQICLLHAALALELIAWLSVRTLQGL